MKKQVALIIFIMVGLSIPEPVNGLGQSGRKRPARRERPTRPKEPPAAKPNPSIPAGGRIDQRKFDPQSATTRYQLKNGLSVIVREKYSKPLVAITVYIKAGQQDESSEAEGVADLLRCLLLQGTSSRPGAQAARELRQLGGVIGSKTSLESTTYQAVVPTENIAEALEIEADIIQHPAFEPETVRRQAALMSRELEARQRNLAPRALQSMLQLAFPTPPPGRRLNPRRIEALTRDRVVSFYRAHYQPEKAVLSVVGAVNPFSIVESVQRAFGGWAKQQIEGEGSKIVDRESGGLNSESVVGSQPTRSGQPPAADNQQAASGQRPPLAAGRLLRYGQQVKERGTALVTIGYRLADVEKTDWAALEVLATVWGGGRASRMRQEFGGAGSGVSNFSINRVRFKTSALWSFQLWIAPEKLIRAEIDFFESVQRLRREVLSPGELQRAQSLLERWYYDRRARLECEAEDLAFYQATAGDYHGADQYVERLGAVTAENVQRVASKYLKLSDVTVYAVLPQRAAVMGVTGQSFSHWVAAKVPGIDKPVAADQVTQAPPWPVYRQGRRVRLGESTRAVIFSLQPEPVRDYSILHGARAYVREDRSLPVVSMGLFFMGGRVFENASNSGITELMLRAMLRGAKSKWDLETGKPLENSEQVTLSPATITAKLEQLGGEIQIVNQPDFFGLLLNVLSRNQDQALKLLIDLIERPTFEEDEFIKVRRELLSDIGRDRPRSVDLAWRALAPKTPYRLPRLGVPQALEKLDPEQLMAWRQRTVGRQFPLAVIVGDTDGSTLVSTVLAREIHRREVEESFQASLPRPPNQPQELVQSGQDVSEITVGFLVPSGRGKESDVFDIIEHAFSGLGGRFTDQLRDRRGLTVKVRVRHDRRLLAGGFFTTVALTPENETQVRKTLEREFNQLASQSLADDEIALGVNAAIASQAVRLQWHPARVLAYVRRVIFNGQPAQVDAYGERLRALTKEKIEAVMRQSLNWNQRGIGLVRRQ